MKISRLVNLKLKPQHTLIQGNIVSISRLQKGFFSLFMLVFSSTLTACSSILGLGAEAGNDDIEVDNIKVHSMAKSTVLSRDVEIVSDEYRNLRNRFDILERLYLDLARHTGFENNIVQTLVTNSNQPRANPILGSDLRNAKSEISTLKNQLRMMQQKLESAKEMEDQSMSQMSASQTPEDQSRVLKNENTADKTDGFGVLKKSERPDPSFQQNPAANLQQPISQQTVLPTAFSEQEPDLSSLSPPKPPEQQYGIHLESLRQKNQALTRWQQASKAFPDILAGSKPLLYRQSTASLTILRLIAGPYTNRNSADKACEMMKLEATGRYCRVTDYIGDPLIG